MTKSTKINDIKKYVLGPDDDLDKDLDKDLVPPNFQFIPSPNSYFVYKS